MKHLKTIAAFSLSLIFGPALSSAQTVITSLPYTISIPGIYVLDQSLHYASGSGNAITVTASNVTINLNGYGIINTADQTTTTARCIYANNVENLTVENGEIFGFRYGVELDGPSSGLNFNAGHILQSLRLAYCTYSGIYLFYANNSLIQNCQVSSIGTTGGGVLVGNGYGIVVYSSIGGNRIYRCQVFNASGTAGYGFFGLTFGSQGSYFEQNLATDCAYGFVFNDSKEAYRDNASFGATTAAFTGGTNVSGNYSQ
jgi:Right handed beta helix region